MSTVKADLKELNIDLSLKNISKLKKQKFKKIVKQKCNEAAFKYLMSEKVDKSKLANLKYDELKPQDYLMNNSVSIVDKKFLFKLRNRMLNVGENMGRHLDMCPLCFIAKDTQSHILKCPIIDIHRDFNGDTETTEIRYEDIFSNNVKISSQAASKIRKRFRSREVLIHER